MKIKLLNQAHPSYDGPRLRRLRALYDGGPAWHALVEHWLPKREVEPAEVYAERKKLATYTNHAGGIVGVLVAMLFAEAPQVEGLDGDYYAGLWEDCDGQGTNWATFWRDRMLDAAIGRYSYTWVNLPARGDAEAEPDNLADELRAGRLDAYLSRLLPEQVIDWETDARGRLVWVMVRDQVSRRAAVEEPRRTVWRWTYLDAEVIRRWEWVAKSDKPEPGDEDEADEVLNVPHRFGRIPVVRQELPVGLWPMGKLEDPVVAATRSRNDLSWALHQAANELLTIQSKWGDEKVTLGHGHYLKLTRDKEGADEAKFVAPSGVAFQYLQEDVQRTREEVYRVVQQMALAADSDAARSRLSGASKAEDWRATDIVLAEYAGLAKRAMREVLALIARIRGDRGAEVTIRGLDGWQEEDLLTFLEAAALATDAAQLSPTFRKEVAKRQAERVLQSAVGGEALETIRREIDEADPEAGRGLFTPTPAPPPRKAAAEEAPPQE